MKIKKKVLVCGATGFIGRNIAEELAQESDFEICGTYFKSRPPRIPKVKMIRADLTDKSEVDSVVRGVDIIIQAAATTSGSKEICTKPYYHVTDNAIMNSLIFRAAYEYKVPRVIFFSCTVMYQPGARPVRENDFDPGEEIFPSYFGVGWTKVYIEKMCEFYSRISDTRYTVVRHSNIYGPHDKFDMERSHVFAATITKVMSARGGGRIVVWGSGEEERDLLYIQDLVDFVKLAVNRQRSGFEVFNAGCGSSICVRDLVKEVIAASGKDIKIEYDPSKPSIKTKLCLDTAKAKKELGWSPKVSLEEGIRKTMRWYEENIMTQKNSGRGR